MRSGLAKSYALVNVQRLTSGWTTKGVRREGGSVAADKGMASSGLLDVRGRPRRLRFQCVTVPDNAAVTMGTVALVSTLCRAPSDTASLQRTQSLAGGALKRFQPEASRTLVRKRAGVSRAHVQRHG